MATDDARIEVDLAWANALRAAVNAAHRGPPSSLAGDALEWTVCAALAAALEQLARDGRLYRLSWNDIFVVAQRERAEITKHRMR
jgi:hypothetical protein